MPSMSELIKTYGIRPRHSWGQNFLADRNTLLRLVETIGLDESDTVVCEFGAGLGALTSAVAAPGRTVVAVERDRDLCEVLRRLEFAGPVEIAEADAQTFDLQALAVRNGGPFKLIGNLPYHISSALLLRTIEERRFLKSAAFLVQSEFAERLTAKAATPEYSILSVLFQRSAKVRRVLPVKRGCFIPVPRVDSSFILIDFIEDPVFRVPDEKLFSDFVRAAFNQRRKTVINSIKGQPFTDFSAAQIAELKRLHPELETRRAEELSCLQFVAIVRNLHTIAGG